MPGPVGVGLGVAGAEVGTWLGAGVGEGVAVGVGTGLIVGASDGFAVGEGVGARGEGVGVAADVVALGVRFGNTVVVAAGFETATIRV